MALEWPGGLPGHKQSTFHVNVCSGREALFLAALTRASAAAEACGRAAKRTADMRRCSRGGREQMLRCIAGSMNERKTQSFALNIHCVKQYSSLS